MSNPFLITDNHEELETAILLEKAIQCDLGTLSPEYKDRVAFTDGKRTFLNSDDNLARLLPAYDKYMLKLLLWHEEYHRQLAHHHRFFKYLEELKDGDCIKEFQVTKDEVNIIMDILVHDVILRIFPELMKTAIDNLAQIRNRNSLKYTFKTFNLEDMLDEYRRHKKGEDTKGSDGIEKEDSEPEDKDTKKEPTEDSKEEPSEDSKEEHSEDNKEEHSEDSEKGHSKGSSKDSSTSSKDKDDTEKSEHHDETDWSKLDNIDHREFITEDDSNRLVNKIEELRRKKFKLAKLTKTLNGLATTTRIRSYAMPSYINTGSDIMLKGRKPGKTALYLCFDASGSMGEELALFKEIISKCIPHAMQAPCEWFAGYNSKISPYERQRGCGYYKGIFKDIMPVYASDGYGDDGDRVIALCLKAEEQGYSPIGITDGGGDIYEPEVLKKLKRTILVGPTRSWLEKAKGINPRIQILDV